MSIHPMASHSFATECFVPRCDMYDDTYIHICDVFVVVKHGDF